MRYLDSDKCSCTEFFKPEHVYVFVGPCVVSGKMVRVEVPAKELNAWRRGELIQKAMPSLTADEREFLMTGISGEEFDKAFKEEE